MKQSPFLFPLALFIIVVSCGILGGYFPYYYVKYYLGTYHTFPEAVANKLRRAVYFTRESSLDPERAIKYYKEALIVADQCKLSPFSNEVIGIKMQIAHFYEVIKRPEMAAKVLEILRRDCIAWLDAVGEEHYVDGWRREVLKKTVQISMKLGDLYASEWVDDLEAAEETLVWAVEAVLKEKQRIQTDGLKGGEDGDIVTDEEYISTLTMLANNYVEKDQHFLATPLYLHALAVVPKVSCQAVDLMNNIGSCLSQQKPPPATLPPRETVSIPERKAPPSMLPKSSPSQTSEPFLSIPAASSDTLQAQAQQWLNKAVALAATIPSDQRTEDCDSACVAALSNLASMAAAVGDADTARAKWKEAGDLAKKVGYKEGERVVKEELKAFERRIAQ